MAELTEDQVRTRVLDHVRAIIGYWNSEAGSNVGDVPSRERLEGLAFSILAMLDGVAGYIPKFVVAPDPHPDDRAFCESRGEDWYPENFDVPVRCDIAGELHDTFARQRNERTDHAGQ